MSSSGWTWSEGLFSHIDPATSSTITSITDYSTISRRSLFLTDWGDNHKSTKQKTETSTTSVLPPPYANPSVTAESSRTVLTDTKLSASTILGELTSMPSASYTVLKEMFTKAQSLDDIAQSEVLRATVTWQQKTNDRAAQVWIAQCQLRGWDRHGTAMDGFNTLRSLSEKNYWGAFYALAVCYLNGVSTPSDTVKPDPHEALRWFKAAASVDIVDSETHEIVSKAEYRIGTMLFKGDDIPEDPAAALQWFIKSAAHGNKYAQYVAGVHFEQGLTTNQDYDQAKHYFLSSAQQGFPDAQAALGIRLTEDGDHSAGMHWLKEAAKSSNARALLRLGLLYEEGQIVEQDYELAFAYYSAAADLNEARAQYILGVHYRLGTLGLTKNLQEAATNLGRSARAGFAPAQRIYGLMHAEGALHAPTADTIHEENVERRQRKDRKLALFWFRRAASQGDVRSLGLVGSCYEHGRGAAVNHEVALEYYQKAANMASPFKQAALLAHALLLHKMGRHRDAFDEFSRIASSQELPNTSLKRSPMRTAKLMVARYLLHGWIPMTKDPATAFEMLSELANGRNDDGHAHYWLGACFEEGIPHVCERNMQKAFDHYLLAAEADDTDAQFQVALMLSNGQGASRDRKAAFTWYEKAAQRNHKTALYSLGLYYAKGLENIPKDISKARSCFEKSARLGFPSAMTSLATLCRMASTRDHLSPEAQQQQQSVAIQWYQKAASLNDPVAQRELGMIYDAGLGVSQSHETAFHYLRKAAEQHDAQATLLLGSYYQNGFAVEKDLNKAIELYLLAADLGAPVAPFAAAQVYHTLNQFEQAYAQYTIAAHDTRLTDTRISKTSQLMVARYVLSYIPSPKPSENDTMHLHNMTMKDAFKILYKLCHDNQFEPAYYWFADCYYQGLGTETNYEEAFQWFSKAADEAKDPEAMVKIASMYAQEDHRFFEPSLALKYYQMSAEHGHPEGQHQLAMAYWRGLFDTAINLGDAVIWFTRSAAQKYAASHWALGQMALENGDRDVAIAWWHKAIHLGHASSMRALASLLLNDTMDHHNDAKLERAMELLAEAVRSGDAESLVLLGQLHQKGAMASVNRPLHSDSEEEAEHMRHKQLQEQGLAIRCFEQAATMGHVESMFLAAESWHTQQQYAAALEYYNKAASHGHMLSRVMRARYRLAGLGDMKADPEAGYQELLKCAEDHQCFEAYNSLGQCNELGLGTPKDHKKALEWYLRSVEKTQDAEAMFRIGRLHAQGLVIALDRHKDLEALQWYQFASDTQNHSRAHYFAGLYKLRGIQQDDRQLLSPNIEEAMHHFQKAAAQGDRDAMFELGQHLVNDDGKYSHDQQMQGLDWLEQSAQLGCQDAQRELGKLYHSGKDNDTVEQNFERAYEYFTLAAQQGDKTAALFLGIYYEHGIHVPASLDLAREWYDIAVKLGQRHEAKGGWWLAELALAQLLHQTDQRNEAFPLFKAAHDHAPTHQRSSAATMLARYRLHGWGNIPAEPEKAAAELVELAQSGDVKLYLEVAQCYEFGIGLTRNMHEAFEWYQRLVSHHHDQDTMDDEDREDQAEALYKLAEFHRHGWATPVDLEKANRLYHLASEKGSKDAVYYLTRRTL
ncbi:uncharacterized protein BYT42DRAFT_542057 [Radiomyces spectabilis]|uniref:uncharacterized protein n=1 Tax=Radiomyces spectabilis TaxID=64574 RepID=UPI00221F7930|nr:uncharacterized protein BYT42DRAFT_542057 [Radiomyces spectabilis]KAI8393861.1 hypothetical protein BYT42DRAFT_542057 [Radiomyces spectabilis]